MKRGTRRSGHVVDFLFPLALFCVFAASALLVVLLGAGVYRNTVEQMDNHFSTRTSLTYVATKIRQNDALGAVHLSHLSGLPALVLEQQVGDSTYQTWIYHYGGYLRETFVRQGAAIDPQNGQEILAVQEFTISHTDSTASFVLTATGQDGDCATLTITPRCNTAGDQKEGAAGT